MAKTDEQDLLNFVNNDVIKPGLIATACIILGSQLLITLLRVLIDRNSSINPM